MIHLTAAAARAVDDCFARFAIDGDDPSAPGIAYGVVVDGVLVHSAGRGTSVVGAAHTPDADTVFRIASMTKSFVASAVLLLRDRGLLRLDDTLALHVPEATGIVAGGDAPAITLRHLLTMSAGLPQDDPWADRNESIAEEALTAIIAAPTSFAWTPGTAFDYSNLSYALLGRAITNVSGTPFRTFIREELIDALGLPATRWAHDDLATTNIAHGYWRADGAWQQQGWAAPGAFSAIGGLYSSVRDIARWAAGFLDAWPAREGPADHPLSRSTRREQQALATAVPLQLELDQHGRLVPVASGYCMGLVSGDDLATGRTVGHSGGYPGFGTHMRWHPATGIGVVALANGRYAPAWQPAAAALRTLVALLGADRRRVAAAPALASLQRSLDAVITGATALSTLDLAPSIDLDDPVGRRQEAIDALPDAHGLLERSGSDELVTPMRGSWRLTGERGSVEVYAALTPETPPRIQELDVSSIAEPPTELARAARALVEAVNDGTAPTSSLVSVARELTVLLAPCSLGNVVASDAATGATFELTGRATTVRLMLTCDATTGVITEATLEPQPRPARPD